MGEKHSGWRKCVCKGPEMSTFARPRPPESGKATGASVVIKRQSRGGGGGWRARGPGPDHGPSHRYLVRSRWRVLRARHTLAWVFVHKADGRARGGEVTEDGGSEEGALGGHGRRGEVARQADRSEVGYSGERGPVRDPTTWPLSSGESGGHSG